MGFMCVSQQDKDAALVAKTAPFLKIGVQRGIWSQVSTWKKHSRIPTLQCQSHCHIGEGPGFLGLWAQAGR